MLAANQPFASLPVSPEAAGSFRPSSCPARHMHDALAQAGCLPVMPCRKERTQDEDPVCHPMLRPALPLQLQRATAGRQEHVMFRGPPFGGLPGADDVWRLRVPDAAGIPCDAQGRLLRRG